MSHLHPNQSAQHGLSDHLLEDRMCEHSFKMQKLLNEVVGVLCKYPNLCTSVEPLMTLTRDYSPTMVFKICLSMAILAPSHAPEMPWGDILAFATNDLNPDEWPELVQAAMEMLDAQPSDYIKLTQAFQGLEQLSILSDN